MSALQVPFGQRPDGRLVEVSQVERGLACDCRCPACGEQLLAKKGTVNVQHFSHRSGSDCATGAETALHLAAKQLIADKRWVQLPELPVQVTRSDPQCGLFAPRKAFGRGEAWRFDRVVLEQKVGDVWPDAVGYIDEVGHAVEILVTHAVDANKQAYLASLRLPSIEIDLAAWVGKVFTFDALESVVITSVENKRWLFHPQQAEWEALLLAGFDDWRRTRLAEMARLKERQVRRPVAPPSREDVYRAANQKYRALSDAEKWKRLERELGLQRNEFPAHLRVALRDGADAVLAEKDLWQGALFAQFILGDDKLDKKVPNERALSVWLAQRFGVNDGDDAARPAVRSYLNYLKACKFLRWQAGDLYVAHSQVTVPVKERPSAPRQHEADRKSVV